jgi:hypothetical protein
VKLLPAVARVHNLSPQTAWPSLWLPLFLLWPLVLVLLIFLLLILTTLSALRSPAELPRVLPFVVGCYVFLSELRGTRVELGGPKARVSISIS